MAARMEKTMAVVTNAKQLAMNRRRRLPADKTPFPCLPACGFTPAFLDFHPVLVRSKRPPGIDLVHADAKLAEVARGVLRERHQRALGCGISHQLRLSDIRIDGSDVDDGSASLLFHVSNRFTHTE